MFVVALNWIEHHPGLASWIQAIFSVVAIGAAACFPFVHERAKEKRAKRDTLTSLIYLAAELGGIQQRLLSALIDQNRYVVWVLGRGPEDLKLFGDLVSEIPASMHVGFHLAYLSELRAGFGQALRLSGYMIAHNFDEMCSMYDYESLVDDQKSFLTRAESVLDLMTREREQI